MALQVKVNQMQVSDKVTKWYGKTVKRQDVTLEDISAFISAKNSVTEFGNFHLTIESEMVDKPSDYRLDQHVKRVKCKFTPASHRVEGGKLSYYFCEGVELERMK